MDLAGEKASAVEQIYCISQEKCALLKSLPLVDYSKFYTLPGCKIGFLGASLRSSLVSPYVTTLTANLITTANVG